MCRAAPFRLVRCRACGMPEDSDRRQLATYQRDLPPDAIACKLHCRCGSRQRLAVEATLEPGPRHDPPWAAVWYL